MRPHEEEPLAAPALRPPAADETRDVVVLGAIGAHKGSRVLLSLARDARDRALPIRFHLIGHSDVAEELRGLGVGETGRYADDFEAAEHVARIGPSLVLLPSIWPETFCYTLTLAFRLGVPPVVFDLGAQAERVRRAGFGFVLPNDLTDDPSALNDRLLALPATPRPPQPTLTAARYPSMVADYYGLPTIAPAETGRNAALPALDHRS